MRRLVFGHPDICDAARTALDPGVSGVFEAGIVLAIAIWELNATQQAAAGDLAPALAR